MRYLLLLLSVVMCCSCSGEQSAPPAKASQELLLFVGITMIDPVKELMTMFEQQTGVKLTMSYGGSADLLQSVTLNKTGDIYFPGVESFIAEADKLGVLKDRKQVGINQAALFVRKGNPLGLSGDLAELVRPDVHVAIGHPDLGSVGKEAKRILQASGVYDQVVAASAMMQPDSKGLSSVLREGKVDVVLNWKAVQFFGDNAQYMDVLPIKGGAATEHKLTMAVTAYSKDTALAQRFLDLCASAEGRAVFQRYGF